MLARALGAISVTSLASRRGATANDLTAADMTSGLARTTSGALAVAASLAFGRLSGLTEAYLDGGLAGVLRIASNGAQTVTASGGGSVDTDATSYDGTGAAAAITLSDLTTRARLGGRLQLDAPSVSVLADNEGASIGSHARSGRGPASLVGALAVGIARTLTTSVLDRGARLLSVLGTTDVAFRSQSTGRSIAGANGAEAPSLVVLVVDHATDSALADGSDLAAPHDARITSHTDDDAAADATGDAGSAITLSTVSTRALLGFGPALNGSGDLWVTADQSAAARTTGSLVALTFARHTTTVRSDRAVTMAGGAQFAATGRSTTSARTLPTATSPSIVAAQLLAMLRSLADQVAVAHGISGSGWAQLPETGSGPVRSVAINAVDASTTSTLPDGVAIVVGGPLGVPVDQILSSSATAGSAGGSGTGADHSAVAVNLVRRTVIAVVSQDVHSSGDLTVRASRGPPAAGSEHSAAAPGGSLVLDLVTSTIRTTVGGVTTGTGPQTPAFTPPAGSVLVSRLGGTVRLGAATLTFAPGALARDTWILIRTRPAAGTGLITVSDVYDLFAFDAATGDQVTTFAVAPRFSVAVGGAAGSSTIWYLDPVDGPEQIASSSSAGTVSAALPHFSPTSWRTTALDLIAGIAAQIASAVAGTPVSLGDRSLADVLKLAGVQRHLQRDLRDLRRRHPLDRYRHAHRDQRHPRHRQHEPAEQRRRHRDVHPQPQPGHRRRPRGHRRQPGPHPRHRRQRLGRHAVGHHTTTGATKVLQVTATGRHPHGRAPPPVRTAPSPTPPSALVVRTTRQRLQARAPRHRRRHRGQRHHDAAQPARMALRLQRDQRPRQHPGHPRDRDRPDRPRPRRQRDLAQRQRQPVPRQPGQRHRPLRPRRRHEQPLGDRVLRRPRP